MMFYKCQKVDPHIYSALHGGDHTSLSPRLGGRLNLGGAVWAVKLICTLLV